jgi:hypothetical protein
LVSKIGDRFFAGVAGAIFGRIYFTALNTTQMQLPNSSPVLVGTVVGAIAGGLIGFVTTASLAAMIFAISQIERNTRHLVANGHGTDRDASAQYVGQDARW